MAYEKAARMPFDHLNKKWHGKSSGSKPFNRRKKTNLKSGFSRTSSNFGGRSSRAYSSNRGNLDSNLDLRNDSDFAKFSVLQTSRNVHERLENKLDRLHDTQIELIKAGRFGLLKKLRWDLFE